MYLQTNTVEPWDFWYELSDWVLVELDMGNMKQDVVGKALNDKKPEYWNRWLALVPPRDNTTITSIHIQDVINLRFGKQAISYHHYQQVGKPRKRGWTMRPGGLAVFIGPEAISPIERAFTGVIHLAAGLAQFGAPKLPEGDLEIFRQPIGKKFMDQHKQLMKMWNQ